MNKSVVPIGTPNFEPWQYGMYPKAFLGLLSLIPKKTVRGSNRNEVFTLFRNEIIFGVGYTTDI